MQAPDSNNGYSTMGVSWESVWGLRESVFCQFFSRVARRKQYSKPMIEETQ
jgi:hypothetical protein